MRVKGLFLNKPDAKIYISKLIHLFSYEDTYLCMLLRALIVNCLKSAKNYVGAPKVIFDAIELLNLLIF